jgi:FtsP/CotA-like multicopper oxidase with cupredoxin domain
MLHPLPLMRMAGTCTPEGPEMQSHRHSEHRASAAQDHFAPAPGADGHAGMHVMGADVTRPQIAAVCLLTLLALIAGLLWSANYGNLTLGVHDVEGAVMAPGMIMTRDTPAASMRDMAAVDPDAIRFTAPADARGDQELVPRIEDGVKVFDLETSVIEWNILPDEPVMAYAFNQVPGPRIRVTEGDRVRIKVTNHLPESTSVHWHGLVLPNAMDGAAEITQEPIAPGQTFTYEFVTAQRGTYFYHTHDHIDRQQALGLYGALIIDPREPEDYPYDYDQELVIQLQELLEREGYSWPAMPMEGGLPNFFTINGKAYPETETVRMRVGETLLVRFIGTNSGFIHPMHIHGGPFRIVETDGNPVPPDGQWVKDTVNVGPGERYDVLWEAREPGKWLLHCHIAHHTTNNNVEVEGGGGLMLIIEVAP